uniref:F-box domain-containing protein n=1 Tax=Leersia perrieri TaxID=77586 RepID=A0A0D9X1J0_9ORYZ
MASGIGRKKRKGVVGLGDLHDDVLERVLARLPPASYFRLRAVCRRWRDAASSNTFLAACRRVTPRDPWFLVLAPPEADEARARGHVAFDAGEGAWCRRAAPPGKTTTTATATMVPVAAAGGRVLYRAADTGTLAVSNPLTGASRVLPSPPTVPGGGALHAVAMYGDEHYRVVLVSGDLPNLLSMSLFDSSTNSWSHPFPLTRNSSPQRAAAAAAGDGDDTVYFLSKSGDVMSTNMQRSAARQFASVVTLAGGGEDNAVVYFLSDSGAVVACDVARHVYAELPRILPVYFEYSIDVVACGGGRAYVAVLSELLGTASLRLWEFAAGEGEWRQVAAMPPAMSHAFYGKKADVNCVGHGDRVMVCVSTSGGDGDDVSGCFMCHVASNRWEELPPCGGGEAMDFVAAFAFEPRMEVAV